VAVVVKADDVKDCLSTALGIGACLAGRRVMRSQLKGVADTGRDRSAVCADAAALRRRLSWFDLSGAASGRRD
jgi:hypothetical protein